MTLGKSRNEQLETAPPSPTSSTTSTHRQEQRQVASVIRRAIKAIRELEAAGCKIVANSTNLSIVDISNNQVHWQNHAPRTPAPSSAAPGKPKQELH